MGNSAPYCPVSSLYYLLKASLPAVTTDVIKSAAATSLVGIATARKQDISSTELISYLAANMSKRGRERLRPSRLVLTAYSPALLLGAVYHKAYHHSTVSLLRSHCCLPSHDHSLSIRLRLAPMRSISFCSETVSCLHAYYEALLHLLCRH